MAREVWEGRAVLDEGLSLQRDGGWDPDVLLPPESPLHEYRAAACPSAHILAPSGPRAGLCLPRGHRLPGSGLFHYQESKHGKLTFPTPGQSEGQLP